MKLFKTYSTSFFVLSAFLLFSVVTGYAQSTKKNNRPPVKKVKKAWVPKYPSYFGLSVSPTFPNNFLESKTAVGRDTAELLTTTFNQKPAYSFGAALRFGITRVIGIETGLYQIRRNYDVNISVPDSNINNTKRLGFVSYDIPINALVYVKLTEKIYSSAALGISIAHYPSDVKDSIVASKHFLQIEGRRIHRTFFAANVGVGFELRTEKAGTFYLGGSAKIPLQPLMFGIGVVKKSGTSDRLSSLAVVNGGFFSADLRYYLPTVKNKGPQLNKSLIE